MDITGDGLDTADRHSKAMGDNADTLIKECLEVMKEYGCDGISFDYEYPLYAQVKSNIRQFLEKLKAAMPDGKNLALRLACGISQV